MDQAESLRQLKKSQGNISQESAPVILTAVTGGKGGVGKSNIALNLSLALMAQGEKVCLLDADFGLANIDVLFGAKPPFNLSHVFSGLKSLKEVIFQSSQGLDWIPASSGLKNLANLSPQSLNHFIKETALLGDLYDRVILDTSAGISQDVLALLKASSEVLVVVTPEPTSMTDAYALIKVLKMEGFQGNVNIVLNMLRNRDEGLRIGERLKKICLNFLGFEPNIIGYFSRSQEMERAVRNQKPFFSTKSSHPNYGEFSSVASYLMKNLGPEKEVGDFFNSMKGMML